MVHRALLLLTLLVACAPTKLEPKTSAAPFELRDTKELLESPPAAPLKTGELDAALDPTSVQQAVNRIDLTGCTSSRDYGRASLTLEPDGHVSQVLIEGPPTMQGFAVTCIGDRLGAVRVEPFRGKPMTVTTTWYLGRDLDRNGSLSL